MLPVIIVEDPLFVIFMISLFFFCQLIGAYSISKTALLGLTKALAPELANSNIRINCLAPGIIQTKFSKPVSGAVCVCVCVLCVRACMHVCMHACMCMFVSLCVCVCEQMCLHLHGYVCMYMYVCMCVCMCTYVHVYVVCVCVCACIHLHVCVCAVCMWEGGRGACVCCVKTWGITCLLSWCVHMETLLQR